MLGANCNYYPTNYNCNFQNNIFAQNSTENFFQETKNVSFPKNKIPNSLLNTNCQPFYPRLNQRNFNENYNDAFVQKNEQYLNTEQSFLENEYKKGKKFSRNPKYSKKNRGIPRPQKKKNNDEESDFKKVTCKRKISFTSQNSSGSCEKNGKNYSQTSASTRTSSFSKEDSLENSDKKKEVSQEKKVETEIKNTPQINPTLENTEILRVNVKISKTETATFKLKRYDDVFYTIKLFCEINGVKEELIKPLIVKSLCTLNTIYQVMNSRMDNEDINLLKKIKNNDFNTD